MHNHSGHWSKSFSSLWALLLFFGTGAELWAAAPLRSGQPYAEADLCARADVILCEDFNYPANFAYTTQNSLNYATWRNPALTGGVTTMQRYDDGRQLVAASGYPAKPQGAMPSSSQPDGVWVGNWDSSKGTVGSSSTWGILRNPGGGYVNGMAAANDIYVRLQVYWTPNYVWPGDPKTDKYNWGAYPCKDNKILYIYPPEGVASPTSAAYDAGLTSDCSFYDSTSNARFSDALHVRVGDAGSGASYEIFPMCNFCTLNPKHQEYQPFVECVGNAACTPYRNPHETPTPGKVFRFDTGRWYTLELHYKLGTAAHALNGVVEVWVDGVRIYSANDLATCGSGLGDCSGIGAIVLLAYHYQQGQFETTVWNGQEVIDNLVAATNYIGPPSGGGGSVDTTPPAAPQNLRTR